MPFALNAGIRIHYEAVGDGPTLLLHHGGTQNGQMWRQVGLVDTLKTDFRVVLMDARGHGSSDKPHDPALYSWIHLVEDVLAVADDLGEERINLLGYSLGGICCFLMAKLARERVNSLIIGGASSTQRNLQAFAGVSGDNPTEFFKAFEQTNGERMPPEFEERLLKTDIRALAAMFNGLLDDPGIDGVLASAQIPCLFFVGETDEVYSQVVASAAEVPDAQIVVMPGYNHRDAFVNSASIADKFRVFVHDCNPAGQ